MSGFRRQTISEFLYVTKYIKAHKGYVNTPRAWTADSLSVYKFAWENGIASTPKFLVNFKESKRNISSIHSDSLKKRDALIIFQKEIKDYIKQIPDKKQMEMLNKSLYYCMYCEILGLCTFSSFLDIFRILLKGGFPRKWIIFILVQKIGNLWKK